MKTQIRCFVLSHLLILNLTAGEYWIRFDASAPSDSGDGSAGNPYVRKTSASFDALLTSPPLPPSSTLHLMAGTFLTRGFLPQAGWKIRGAGMDVTTLKLEDLGTNVTNYGESVIGSTDPLLLPTTDGCEVSDLTVDCNLQSQTTPIGWGAVALVGSDTRISRVKAINWGARRSGDETFVLTIWNRADRPITKNCVIEDCIVTTPAPTQLPCTADAIGILGSTLSTYQYSPGNGWISGAEIRGCVVRDVNVNVSGTNNFQKPQVINAYFVGGAIGAQVHHNVALNLGDSTANGWPAYGYYSEGTSSHDILLENNRFLNVSRGIFQNTTGSYTHDNHTVRGNHITMNGPYSYGIIYYGNSLKRVRNLTIANNTVHRYLEFDAGSGPAYTGVSVWYTDNLVCEYNLIDSNGGPDLVIDPLSVTVAACGHNRNRAGTACNADANLGAEQQIVFTPSSSGGWYRLLATGNRSGGLVKIFGENVSANTVTDIEFDYSVLADSLGAYGDITQVRSMYYNGGAIDQIRIAGTSSLSVYLDVHVRSQTTPDPLRVLVFGDKARAFVTAPSLTSDVFTANFQKVLTVAQGFKTLSTVP